MNQKEKRRKQALKCAKAYVEGIQQHKTNESKNTEKYGIKQELVFMVNEKRNPCTICGFEFTKNLLPTCKAENEQSRSCAMSRTFRTNMQNSKIWQLEREMKKRQLCLKEIGELDWTRRRSIRIWQRERRRMVLHVNGSGYQPFVLKVKIIEGLFTAMIDSGSTITVFSPADLQKIPEVDVIFARPLPSSNILYITTINRLI